MIGVLMIPNAFAESIIKEKDCEAIGKEINPMIECRIVLVDWFYPTEGVKYDDKNNMMYLSTLPLAADPDTWQGVDMNTFETTNDMITCEKTTTGTYVKETTTTCMPDIEDWQEFGVSFVKQHLGYVSGFNLPLSSYNEYFEKTQYAVSSSTDKKYIYFVTTEGSGSKYYKENAALYSKEISDGEHSEGNWTRIKTDLRDDEIQRWRSYVFHNEESNKVYYFLQQAYNGPKILYVINGMGTKLTAVEAPAVEAPAPESPAQQGIITQESIPKIPDWVRNIFIWYGEEKISEDELLNAIKFLVNQGIINLNE